MPETGSSSRLFTGRCALVPAQFFEPGSARAMLVEVSEVDDAETVSSVAIPYYDAVLVYAHQAGETALPELYHLLKASESISDHNRILASYHEGRLYLVVVEDRSLKICNSFAAMDFVTAEYFLFMVLKRLQMNPEISSVHFMTPLTGGQKMSLYRYFRSVDYI